MRWSKDIFDHCEMYNSDWNEVIVEISFDEIRGRGG